MVQFLVFLIAKKEKKEKNINKIKNIMLTILLVSNGARCWGILKAKSFWSSSDC